MRPRTDRRKRKLRAALLFALLCVVAIASYSWITNVRTEAEPPSTAAGETAAPPSGDEPSAAPTPSADSEADEPSEEPSGTPASSEPTPSEEAREVNADGIPVAAEPDSITALINKENSLPDEYDPTDLVYPDVRFLFEEKIEKRMMRKEAAEALEKLFAGAEEDGIYLAGVSAYRSYSTQKSLFERYVEQDGYEKARTYSAVPGTSEHQTGLAIDVSGSDGKCAAESCFGGTPEAEWLEEHAPEYGFIIRYPEGKEDITGYKYEPWHLRYVGEELAQELAQDGKTLEEYYNAVPVAQ
ncbi:D-alanyl-D-alanine carboxypeptidase family protein [Paenibacillus thailandensis]|uniref:D-alanyl-D-alanine carboxypeptidase family protein n=1 Tax=Paenibacillus thailandensis TaxID=393250 RepID=A0ABW5R438_9BACL